MSTSVHWQFMLLRLTSMATSLGLLNQKSCCPGMFRSVSVPGISPCVSELVVVTGKTRDLGGGGFPGGAEFSATMNCLTNVTTKTINTMAIETATIGVFFRMDGLGDETGVEDSMEST